MARILTRVRISTDVLRLSALVTAGVASGYLWRAAFEPGGPADLRPLAPAVSVVAESLDRPPVRVTLRAAPAERVVRAGPRVKTSRSRLIRRSRTQVTRKPAPAARPESRSPSSQPSPKPSSRPISSPPARPPSSGSGAPAASSPPPAVAAPPQKAAVPVAAAAKPAKNTAPKPAKNTPAASAEAPGTDGDRSGWGKRDKNHDHSGPSAHGGKG